MYMGFMNFANSTVWKSIPALPHFKEGYLQTEMHIKLESLDTGLPAH